MICCTADRLIRLIHLFRALQLHGRHNITVQRSASCIAWYISYRAALSLNSSSSWWADEGRRPNGKSPASGIAPRRPARPCAVSSSGPPRPALPAEMQYKTCSRAENIGSQWSGRATPSISATMTVSVSRSLQLFTIPDAHERIYYLFLFAIFFIYFFTRIY